MIKQLIILLTILMATASAFEYNGVNYEMFGGDYILGFDSDYVIAYNYDCFLVKSSEVDLVKYANNHWPVVIGILGYTEDGVPYGDVFDYNNIYEEIA